MLRAKIDLRIVGKAEATDIKANILMVGIASQFHSHSTSGINLCLFSCAQFIPQPNSRRNICLSQHELMFLPQVEEARELVISASTTHFLVDDG